ncbi:hypothetical protein L6R53_05345 [Myxococcota bacterium]|nr:hypothetical protein [Myxococcota bacterium]
MHQLYWGFARWALVDRGELPLWNPYMCGGTAGLAHPESPVGNPLFPVLLVTGTVRGLKLLTWAHAALAGFGAWLLGRRLGCGPVAAYVPAAAYGLSSAYALHLATGHSTWMAMAFLPLALAGLHAGFLRPPMGLLAGAAAALVLFTGNPNLFAWLFFVAGTWATVEALRTRSARPLAALAVMVGSAVGLAAVKLVPMIAFLGEVTSKEMADTSSGDLRMLGNALLGRDQRLLAHLDSGLHWAFWEYGAYVGPVIPLAALAYGLTRPRRAWPLLVVAGACLWVALGHGYGAWDLLARVPGFTDLRVPSRVLAFVPLLLGTLAGLLLTEHGHRLPRGVEVALVAAIALDLGSVGRVSLHDAFPLPARSPPGGDFIQVQGRTEFQRAFDPTTLRPVSAFSEMYPAFLANRGTVDCYGRVRLPVAAVPAIDAEGRPNPAWRGEAWLPHGGQASLVEVGGQRLVAELQPLAAGGLVFNQNWAPGWDAADGRPVHDAGGLLAVAVGPEDRRVELVYTQPGLAAGAATSVATLLAVLLVILRRRT